MRVELITKRSPIVLMWKFAAIEAAGFLLYFIATLFGNRKYDLYVQLSFVNLLSYEAAKIILILGAQFAMTVYAFLSWYYEEYAVRPASVTHTKGVFLKKEYVFQTEKISAPQIKQGFMGKIFHYGSVCLKNGASGLVLAHISRPERVIMALKGEYNSHEDTFGKEPDIKKLLIQEEHGGLEFKSSLRFDHGAGNVNRELEKAAMKTIAAFLNSKGGHLVIGVNDRREPIGLKKDYESIQRGDSDGFENHFTQAFNNMIGPQFRNLIKIWFHEVGGEDVCVIRATQSPQPVYFKTDNNEYFYVRTGNISTPLKFSEMEAYARERWPKRIS